MDYTEQQADKIIKKYGFSNNVKQVWKHRGKIPNKYADDSYEPPKPLNRKQLTQKQRLRELLREGVFNSAALAEMAGVTVVTCNELKRHNILTSNNLKKLVTRMRTIKANIRNTHEHGCSTEAFLVLLKKLPDIVIEQTFQELIEQDRERIRAFRSGKANISDELAKRACDELMKVAVRIDV